MRRRMQSTLASGAAAATAAVAIALGAGLIGGEGLAQSVEIELDADDIGGVVTSADGPEAGVWVVAETTDLPTRFIRIVATDDQGRYVLPDLPDATYEIFVRGYGLVDSERVSATPGQALALDAVVAPDALAAAEVYPAAWWLSMMELPDGEHSQQELGSSVTGCLNCHQIGNEATRAIPDSILSGVDSHLEAWDRRVAMGPMGSSMAGAFRRLGPQRAMFADWTDRIASGEAPTQTPPRPTGAERNVVVTLWDWGTEHDGRTDSTPSDVRDGTVNANGLVYGVVQPSDILAVIDPVEHRAFNIPIPSNAPPILTDTPTSPYYGNDPIWARRSDPRSVAMDGEGRVWLTGRIRAPDEQPDFCTDSENAFADYFPLEVATRQVFLYDPASEEFSEIDTCFSSDHNQLGHDERFYYGFRDGVGWVDVELWDETGDAEASQGWCPTVIDTNGDGVITPGWTEPGEAIDPTRDARIAYGCYSPAANAADDSVWCSDNGRDDNTLVRLELGDNPPETCIAEVYMPPPSVMDPPAYGKRRPARHPRRHHLAGLARQRPLRLVRPQRLHRQERSDRDGAELSRGLDVLPHGQADVLERRDADQLGRKLPDADRSSRRARVRPRDAGLRRGQHRLAGGVRPVNAGVRDAAHPVSNGLLLTFVGRPHRRPDHRLEGEGALVELLELRRVASGGWTRHPAEGGEVPGAAASACEVGRRSWGPDVRVRD